MWDISDWLERHSLDVATVQDIVAACRVDALATRPPAAIGQHFEARDGLIPGSRERALAKLVTPALASAFADADTVTAALSTVRFEQLADGTDQIPHTIDPGPGRPPVIFMNWQGRADDLICLAHEVAHALQMVLSDHAAMPPVAREACAFLGELLLLEHARQSDPTLYAALLSVWDAENKSYLGPDLERLSDAVGDPGTAYRYRLNYPLARLAAVSLIARGSGPWLDRLFASGVGAMAHLRLEDMAGRAGDGENHLPPMLAADPDTPTLAAYRSLGAMVLLDVEYWQGESEKQIGAYYSGLADHMRARTCFVALNTARKPIGYATWTTDTVAGRTTLTRQAAPFGDHLALQKLVGRHLADCSPVVAHHPTSARPEQVAW